MQPMVGCKVATMEGELNSKSVQEQMQYLPGHMTCSNGQGTTAKQSLQSRFQKKPVILVYWVSNNPHARARLTCLSGL